MSGATSPLDLPELRHMIIDNFRGDPANLLSLSLINKIWFSEAMPVLWRRLGRIGPAEPYKISPPYQAFQSLPDARKRIYVGFVREIANHFERDEEETRFWENSHFSNVHAVMGDMPPSLIQRLSDQIRHVSAMHAFSKERLEVLARCSGMEEFLTRSRISNDITSERMIEIIRGFPRLKGLSLWFHYWKRHSPELIAYLLEGVEVPAEILLGINSIFVGHGPDAWDRGCAAWSPEGIPPLLPTSLQTTRTALRATTVQIILCRHYTRPITTAPTPTILPYLAIMGALRHLKVELKCMTHGSAPLKPWDVPASDLLALRQLGKLRTLTLGGVRDRKGTIATSKGMTDSIMDQMLAGLSSLRKLSFGLLLGRPPVTSKLLDSIQTHCPGIRSIRIVPNLFDVSSWSLDEEPRFPNVERMEIYAGNLIVRGDGPSGNAPMSKIEASEIAALMLHHVPCLDPNGLWAPLCDEEQLLRTFRDDEGYMRTYGRVWPVADGP